MITVNVKRYDPEEDKHYIESYEIEKTDNMKVLDALQQINNKYDAKIAYRYSCRAGQCGSCAIKINGKAKLACKAEINDNDTLEPLDFKVLRDLIVDREPLNSKTKEYVGPYFMRAYSDICFDPREDFSRSEEAVDSGIYCCTSCGQCSKTCPKEIDIYGKAIEKLRAQICSEKEGPLAKHIKIREAVLGTGRSVQPDENSKYPEGFIKEYNKQHHFEEKPKIAFFTGCMIDNKLPWIAEYFVKILSKLGYEVDIPEGQVCCGSPLMRTGQVDIIPDLVNTNYEIFKDYDLVLTVCAGCGSTLKNNYPDYGVKLNVMDITEFLQGKLNTEDMKKLNLRVTYHDPCHLVRGQGISEEPRNILKQMNGVEFIEMDKPDLCCGAGGGVKSGKPEIANALADDKVEMIEKLDVDYVVTICPFCEFNIQDALNRNNSDTSVINLMELLNQAYE